jgi:hypothetical protein
MEQVNKYFTAEKNESILFLIVGFAAIAVGLYFLIKIKEPFYNGLAYPLIAVAILQIIVGGTVLVRSPKDISRVNTIIQNNKVNITTKEIPRMEVVMKNFSIYKWIEISLLMLGILLFVFCKQATFFKGLGLGFAIQSTFMLLLDFFAESRGKTYLQFLQSII